MVLNDSSVEPASVGLFCLAFPLVSVMQEHQTEDEQP